jgi:hypothetical protein
MKFYSEKLKKLFDTEKELVAAEKVVDEENEKKKLASEQKKADASKVEEAFKAHNAAKVAYNTKVAEAHKKYSTAINEAKKEYNSVVTVANEELNKSEEAFNTALSEFTKKHGSYHMTLKDGDNVMTVSNQNETLSLSATDDFVNYIFDYLFRK